MAYSTNRGNMTRNDPNVLSCAAREKNRKSVFLILAVAAIAYALCAAGWFLRPNNAAPKASGLSFNRTGPTTTPFLTIRAGDGDGARPVYMVPAQPSHAWTQPATSSADRDDGQ